MTIKDVLNEMDEALHKVGVPIEARGLAIDHMEGVLKTYGTECWNAGYDSAIPE